MRRPWRSAAQHVLGRIGHDLWGWLVGQFFDMLIVGRLCGVGLMLLGMPLAFVLGVIAELLNFVPYIGAIGGALQGFEDENPYCDRARDAPVALHGR